MKTEIDLQQRLLKAREYKGNGYNCAQCMFMAFSDLHNLDEQTALRLSCGLGGGVGGERQICGVLSTIASLLGMKNYNSPADKAKLYRITRVCIDNFREQNGSILCAELKGSEARKSCMEYIEDGIKILHSQLSEK